MYSQFEGDWFLCTSECNNMGPLLREDNVHAVEQPHMYKYLQDFPEDWFYNDTYGEFYMKTVLYQ